MLDSDTPLRDPDLPDQAKRDKKAFLLLKKSPEKWNATWSNRTYPFDHESYSPKFDGMEFKDFELTGVDFFGAAVGVKFVNCFFDNCSFDSIHFERSTFDKCVATDSNFACSHFENCKFKTSSFEGCDLEDVWMFDVDLKDVAIRHCILNEASFDGSLFHEVNLEFSRGHWASFDKVKFFATQFYGAHLLDSSFNSVRLIGREIWQKENSFLISSDYDSELEYYANITGADFSSSAFVGASLAGLDFGNTDLTNTVFAWCDLSGTDFRKCKGLWSGGFRGSDLSGAKLPDYDIFDYRIERINHIVALARPAYLANLITCGALIALFVFGDPSGNVSIPLFQTSLKPHEFALFGVLQSTIISLYVSLYLIRIWESVSHLPTVLPNGIKSPEAISPWSALAPVWLHTRVISGQYRFNFPKAYWFQFSFAIVSHWMVTAITTATLIASLWDTDPKFRLPASILLTANVVVPLYFYRMGVCILRADAVFSERDDTPPWEQKKGFRNRLKTVQKWLTQLFKGA